MNCELDQIVRGGRRGCEGRDAGFRIFARRVDLKVDVEGRCARGRKGFLEDVGDLDG